jgi:hypothetical protein
MCVEDGGGNVCISRDRLVSSKLKLRLIPERLWGNTLELRGEHQCLILTGGILRAGKEPNYAQIRILHSTSLITQHPQPDNVTTYKSL